MVMLTEEATGEASYYFNSMFVSYTTSHICLDNKDRIVHDIHKPNVGNQTLCDNDKRDRLNKCPSRVIDPLDRVRLC